MKKLIIAAVIGGGIYYGLNNSGDATTDHCSKAGGEMTSMGCLMPMTEEKCNTLGGTLRANGDCQTKMTESSCSSIGGELTANNECHITQ